TDDQLLLAKLALGHHGKVSKLPVHEPTRSKWLTLLCLRLAVLLSRRREDKEDPPVSLDVNGNNVIVRADKKWLNAHPLSEYCMQGEKREWDKAGFELELLTR